VSTNFVAYFENGFISE